MVLVIVAFVVLLPLDDNSDNQGDHDVIEVHDSQNETVGYLEASLPEGVEDNH